MSGQGSQIKKTLNNFLNLEVSLVMYSISVQEYEIQK
jgi:hypothetical protein